MSVTIRVSGIRGSAMTEDDGLAVRHAVGPVLAAGGSVVLDFAGVRFFTCSFFNALTGYYVMRYGSGYVDGHISAVNLNDAGRDAYGISCANAELVAARTARHSRDGRNIS